MAEYTNIRDTVLEAALAMELKLRKHDRRRGKRAWLRDDPDDLIKRIGEELREAFDELGSGNYSRAAQELVDVMNMAMMARDVCLWRELLSKDLPERASCYEQWGKNA